MGELKNKAARYAESFDGASPLSDEENRSRKAAKIRAVLEAEGSFVHPGVRILDIGCSFGIILERVTPMVGSVSGWTWIAASAATETTSRSPEQTPKIYRSCPTHSTS